MIQCKSSVLRAATLAISVLAAASAAHAGATAEKSAAAQSYTYAFRDAEVPQVADAILGQGLGVAFTVDPSITSKMTFRIDQRLTKAQLIEAFEAALAANDIALVRDGETLHLTPMSKAKSAASIQVGGEERHHAGYAIVAVPLAYAAPSEIAKALETIAPKGTVIYTNDKQGLLLLGGSGPELDAALQTVKVFDRSGMDGVKIRWFALTRAPAQTVASDLDNILHAAGVDGVSLVPLKRLNGIFVFARSSAELDKVAAWVVKLDQQSAQNSATLFVYHPKNSSAEGLSRTLNSVLSAQTGPDQGQSTSQDRSQSEAAPAPQIAPAAAPPTRRQSLLNSGDDAVRIGVDKESNTLLISAPPGEWIQIQRILDEIDRPPAQVLIEASILEVTLTKNFQFGVDWSVLGAGGKLNLSQIGNVSGAIGAQSPGFAVTFLNKDIQTAVNTLSTVTTVEVVSAPKIMALDNHTAKLQVGDQVPVASQSAESTSAPGAPIVSSINYLSTGVILNVTPRVSGDDKVMLDVSQEVSEASQTTTSGINSPTIEQRKFESTLYLKSGGTVALGGLISSTRTKNGSGIPFLKDIPGLGSAFKTDSNDLTRTELIVLLSAKVIHDDTDAKNTLTKLEKDMDEVQGSGLLKLPR